MLPTANDTTKVVLLNKIALKLADNNSFEIATTKASDALELSKNIGFKRGEFLSFMSMGLINYLKDDYSAAIKNYEQALKIAQEGKDKLQEAGILTRMANVYLFDGQYGKVILESKKALKTYERENKFTASIEPIRYIAIASYQIGSYDIALEYYIRALRIAEQTKLSDEISSLLIGVGNVYLGRKEYDKALLYYQDAYDLSVKRSDDEYSGQALNNLGQLYIKLKNYATAQNYFLKALELKEKNSTDKNAIINTLLSIGNTYLLQGNYAKAMDFYERSYKLSEQLQNTGGIASSKLNIGILYNRKKQYSEGINYILSGIELAEKVGRKDLLKSGYEELSDAYSQ